jgi:hypothetical protein
MLICALFEWKLICALFEWKLICALFERKLICALFEWKLICALFEWKLICALFEWKRICALFEWKLICAGVLLFVYSCIVIDGPIIYHELKERGQDSIKRFNPASPKSEPGIPKRYVVVFSSVQWLEVRGSCLFG